MTLPPRPREWQLTGLAGIRGPVEQVQAGGSLARPSLCQRGWEARESLHPASLPPAALPRSIPDVAETDLSQFKVECVTPTSASSRGSPDLLT